MMLKDKQLWCLLATWLLSIVLCFGNQSICFTEFDDDHNLEDLEFEDPLDGSLLDVSYLICMSI